MPQFRFWARSPMWCQVLDTATRSLPIPHLDELSDRRVDAVREELQEAAQASPNGCMAAAFKILRRTRPSARQQGARARAGSDVRHVRGWRL
eukprot:scaffold22888_cov33-Phaeocystis_antarctica.AAC.1